MKVLLAIDGSTCGDAAVDSVASRPWPAGTEVKILSAVEPAYIPASEPWAVPPTYLGEVEKANHERAQATVASAAAKLAASPAAFTVTTDIPVGWPKQIILEEAESWGADLIVMGSHGYGAWERFLLGSVSNAVATHAGCSVEIVRHRPEPATVN